MEISYLETKRKMIPLNRPFVTSVRTVTSIENVEVSVMLEDGTAGRGAAAPALAVTGESPSSIEAVIKGPAAEALAGAPSGALQENVRKLKESCYGNFSAKAAVEMALINAFTKQRRCSLLEWLGGEPSVLENDMTISMEEPERMKNTAEQYINEGFRYLKMKVGDDVRKDYQRILAIAEVLPPGVMLRIDANQGWTSKEAIAFIQQLEKERIPVQFIEQPVAAGDWEGLKKVTESTGTPIMADESCKTYTDARRLVEQRACDMINIKLMKCGGLLEAWKIADVAEAAGIPCMMGSMMESTISASPAAELALAHPNIKMIDLDAPNWIQENNATTISFEGHQIKPLKHAQSSSVTFKEEESR
ncbi:hypothetical protein CHL76_15190 [Marinococcus halophilus]|uniref:Dipeptide epimerase n=1 Tax=Marinococcus halophilus TaxID=1371 RepID=A0A510Y5E5_MARHA|nr:dipeptide epimerase [Marinococcus halophilus]OZT78969.1 hypothetical protein CHL76_15190 [Marinococcus halophilus]GEK58586.1 dipeptide epimerase [Marinococcus halophilus]